MPELLHGECLQGRTQLSRIGGRHTVSELLWGWPLTPKARTRAVHPHHAPPVYNSLEQDNSVWCGCLRGSA